MSMMRKLFGTALLAGMLFAGSPAFSAPQVAVGIRIGPPPRPRVIRVRPVAPGPGLLLGGWLLVSGRSPLSLASRVLDASSVRGCRLGWPPL